MSLTRFFYFLSRLKVSLSNSATWVKVCLASYFIFIVHLVIPNNGGTQGDNLPWVLTGWIMVCLMMAAIWFTLSPERGWRITSTIKGVFLACLLLTLPLVWSPYTNWQYHALPRLAGLWGGGALFFVLLQCRLNKRHWHIIWGIIAVSALIQAVFVLVEIFLPNCVPVLSQKVTQNGNFGYGVFQQKNVTASFLATGLVPIMMFFLIGHSRFWLIRWTGVAIILLSMTVVLLHSRIGLLSIFVTFVLLLILTRFTPEIRVTRRKALLLLMLFSFGVILGFILSHFESDALRAPHVGSDIQRWLTLKVSVLMLAESPWTGWGYGGFEYAFQHWIALQHVPIPSRELMNHPHNEILFWGVEGGIIPLVGIALLIVVVLRLILHKCSPQKLLICIMSLPILLHTQLEYPIYQSVAHWIIILLVLVNLDDVDDVEEKRRDDVIKQKNNNFHTMMGFVSLGFVFLLSIALYNEIVLTKFELRQLPNSEIITKLHFPWLAHERVQQDLALLNIIRYEQDGNQAHLLDFLEKAKLWSETRMDPDMYDNIINVETFLGNKIEATKDREEAKRLFPYDDRF